MNTKPKYVMGIDPITSDLGSVAVAKVGSKGQTIVINPEKVNGTHPEGIVTEECDLKHITKAHLETVLESIKPELETSTRELKFTTAYRGQAHQQFIEAVSKECARQSLHYKQMDPKYMLSYDVDLVKQHVWDEMSDNVKAMYMALKTTEKVKDETR